MDHPIYDVWVLDCLKTEEERASLEEEETSEIKEGEGVIEDSESPATPDLAE